MPGEEEARAVKPDEAIEEIRVLQKYYGQGFKGRDLNPIWKDLLEFPREALVWTVKEIKFRFSRLPEAKLIVDICRDWHPQIEAKQESSLINDGFLLLRAFYEERITAKEYAFQLRQLAKKHNDPAYVRLAEEVESKQQAG